MKEVANYEFISRIADDLKINDTKQIKTYSYHFPFVNGKRKIKSTHDAIIVDKQGNEFPYMITHFQRNEEKLLDFDYIYVNRQKSIGEIIEETGVEIKTERCKICEGGGWYSWGTRYIYKDIFCEI